MSRRMSAWVGFVALILVVSGVLPVAAQGLLSPNTSIATAGLEPSFGIGVGVRKYLNSFTSWQFPNRLPPHQDPYSRLEWPWDQTFFVARTAVLYSNIKLNLEVSGTLSTLSNPKAQDSDWEDNNNPGQKTTFSEAEARPRCWIFDVGVEAPIIPAAWLKGIVGYRVSQFKFTSWDMTQWELGDPRPYSVPGPDIEFAQYYKEWYAGGAFDTVLNLERLSRGVRLPPLFVRVQVDASYVTGTSRDDHLLSPKIAEIDTRGSGWHANLSLGIQREWLSFSLEADARRIKTTGNLHGMFGDAPGQAAEDISVDGTKVWSEQKYV